MINGKDNLYVAKKSFTIYTDVIVMEGDVLKLIATERDENKNDDLYYTFEVVNSAWCLEMEVTMSAAQIADRLKYKTIYV